MSGRIVVVSNTVELRAALNARTADTTIALKQGNYGEITFNARESAMGITLKAFDPGKPPIMEAMTITNANGVSIEGLQFSPRDKALFANGLTLRNCEDVVLKDNLFKGGDGAMASQQRGLLIDRSADLVVTGNDFTGLMRGAVITNTTDVKVTHNEVWSNRSEGFNFAAVKNVEVAHNKMSDFRPVTGDHPDFIQFWTRGAKSASENIHIHHNELIQKNPGLSVQGIFMDNDDQISYRNVVIEHNTIQTGMPRGILVQQVDGVTVANNVALAVDGANAKVSIQVVDATGAKIAGNSANGFSIDGSASVAASGNLVISERVTGERPLTAAEIMQLRAESLFIHGTSGADRLFGTHHDDIMLGGAGNDILSGGRGDDVLVGGAGNDAMTGGAGADRFVFNAADLTGRETDIVRDLNFAEGDRLEFSGFTNLALKASAGVAAVTVGGLQTLVLDSAADLAALGRLEAVQMEQRGRTDTLIMRITQADGDVQELQMTNMFAQFLQAGGQIG
jgi:hypothetical protein